MATRQGKDGIGMGIVNSLGGSVAVSLRVTCQCLDRHGSAS
jgi:hypothetical protein